MSVDENVRLDQENLAAWDTHNVDRALSILSDDVVWYDVGSPEPLRGKDAVRQYIQGWFKAFPDMHLEEQNRVVSNDQVAAELSFTGTNSGPLQMAAGTQPLPPTGKRINGKGTYFFKVRNGKAIEVHTYPDLAGMMMQLGLNSQSSSRR